MTEFDVTESDVLDRFDLTKDLRLRLKELHGLIDRHLQDVSDGLTFPPHFEGLTVVTLTAAHFAGYIHIRHEMHLDRLVAVTHTLLASSAFGVERETTCFPASYLRFRQLSKEITDVVEHIRISRRIRARRTTNRRLIDIDDLIDELNALNALIGQRGSLGAIELLTQNRVERLVDQGAFSTAAHAGHANHLTQRNLHRHVLEVIPRTSAEGDESNRRSRSNSGAV